MACLTLTENPRRKNQCGFPSKNSKVTHFILRFVSQKKTFDHFRPISEQPCALRFRTIAEISKPTNLTLIYPELERYIDEINRTTTGKEVPDWNDVLKGLKNK